MFPLTSAASTVAVLTCHVLLCCRVHGLSCVLAAGAKKLGLSTVSDTFFDTVTLKVSGVQWTRRCLNMLPHTCCSDVCGSTLLGCVTCSLPVSTHSRPAVMPLLC
mgnify:CR=1 FL=1